MAHDSSDKDLLTASYLYPLPKQLIAHHPAGRRDQSRLLVMPGDGPLEHRVFSDLPRYLRAGDCLVINDTRVIPARLFGKEARSDAKVEFLLLAPLGGGRWRTLVKPGKRARPGDRIRFDGGKLEASIEAVEADGARIAAFDFQGDFMALLERIGEMPLPPYIQEKLDDPPRYQTVYARAPGSAAAPTAGLHFTQAMLEAIEAMGVSIARLTLHVGVGTFRPVKEAVITDHRMHCEPFSLDAEAIARIERAKSCGGRVIAVGTTSCRVLESAALDAGGKRLQPCSGETDLFIYPGFQFKLVDALVTNFHLPGSTLLMLVAALAGREKIMEAYRTAVEEQYRFFSFGDAMLLLPQGV
ncbi:MAG: tRNA preQ1(34) S-adenosylmethionine ribosyltransferase-isomerase QueA [Clostridiaceae bacterium]|nr:tRNA preQ1(34) S-adenosylmethionine ribosyltransferase-isomerase QueA [Clostridiaceae bacterium]